MIEHIDRNSILKERISGCRRGHSTATVLLRFIRDDIIQAMKRGELTMAMIFTDFSQALDTVDHTRIVEKNAQHGICKVIPTLDSKLHW